MRSATFILLFVNVWALCLDAIITYVILIYIFVDHSL